MLWPWVGIMHVLRTDHWLTMRDFAALIPEGQCQLKNMLSMPGDETFDFSWYKSLIQLWRTANFSTVKASIEDQQDHHHLVWSGQYISSILEALKPPNFNSERYADPSSPFRFQSDFNSSGETHAGFGWQSSLSLTPILASLFMQDKPQTLALVE